jgi:hypothetical protein
MSMMLILKLSNLKVVTMLRFFFLSAVATFSGLCEVSLNDDYGERAKKRFIRQIIG